MRTRPERLTAYSAFAALALGAAGTLFERADPSVLSAGPVELRAWTRAHHDALVAQSVIFSLSCAPLLVFFAGLGAALRPDLTRIPPGRVDAALVVLAGGALWVAAQLVGQGIQVSMATAATHGEHAGFVASLRDLMRTILAWGNLPLAMALGASAVAGYREQRLPRWLTGLSAVTAAVHVLPVAVGRERKGLASSDGVLAYLPYPLFAGWMASVAVTLLRRARAPRTT